MFIKILNYFENENRVGYITIPAYEQFFKPYATLYTGSGFASYFGCKIEKIENKKMVVCLGDRLPECPPVFVKFGI